MVPSPFGPINQVCVNKSGLNEHITAPIMLPGLVLGREQTIKTLPRDSKGSEVNKLFWGSNNALLLHNCASAGITGGLSILLLHYIKITMML